MGFLFFDLSRKIWYWKDEYIGIAALAIRRSGGHAMRYTKINSLGESVIELKRNGSGNWSISDMADGVTIRVHSEAIDKLAEFEDFMVKLGFENLEQLEQELGFVQWNERLRKSQFTTYKYKWKQIKEALNEPKSDND